FEKRVLAIRTKEVKYQKHNYTIEASFPLLRVFYHLTSALQTLWNALWNGSPMLFTLVSFWHFAIFRAQVLTPSIAFTSTLGTTAVQ
ncbi:hypothetical protein HYPSUDRAFT_143351, partial [Hypholoma sublateritium FD-334 SS-4]